MSSTPMPFGRIVKTNSHVEYLCRIYGHLEESYTPAASDFAFGRFVMVTLEDTQGNFLGHVVGVVFNTLVMDPDFGAANRSQLDGDEIEVTLPTYMQSAFTMVEIAGIGWQDTRGHYAQTIPPHAPLINAEVRAMFPAEVQHFHKPRDDDFQVDYLTYLVSHSNPLVGHFVLQQIQWLQKTFPEQQDELEVIYNIVAWRSIIGVLR